MITHLKAFEKLCFKNYTHVSLFVCCFVVLVSCSVQKQIAKQAEPKLINYKELQNAHIGISLYDASTGKFLYQHNADKYFTPASNTKLLTCYAALKYLKDSITGARVAVAGDKILLIPNGDPTFLHPDFTANPLLDYLRKVSSNKTVVVYDANFQDEPYGDGWSWNDFTEDYMPQRSALPIYGNLVTFNGKKNNYTIFPAIKGQFIEDSLHPGNGSIGKVTREWGTNNYKLTFNITEDNNIAVPFFTAKGATNAAILSDVLQTKVSRTNTPFDIVNNKFVAVQSQPLDSLLKITMHRSDNFFAEQILLMGSNEKLGVMDDELIIQTLLETDLSDLPQKPRWVDGSGLSRYNLFTPNDLVMLLTKMKNQFDWKRITTILPSPGNGTLDHYNEKYANNIFAKTGTLSNNVALSGYLITKKGRTLIFSILVANHMTTAANVRKQIEAFIEGVVETY